MTRAQTAVVIGTGVVIVIGLATVIGGNLHAAPKSTAKEGDKPADQAAAGDESTTLLDSAGEHQVNAEWWTRAWRTWNHVFLWGGFFAGAVVTAVTGIKAGLEKFGEQPRQHYTSWLTIGSLAAGIVVGLSTTLSAQLKPGDNAVRAANFAYRFRTFKSTFSPEKSDLEETYKGKPELAKQLRLFFLRKSEELGQLTTAWDSDQPLPPKADAKPVP